MERRGIGHLVPILGGRRLPEVVPLVGGACPSGYCQVDMAVHLVGPVPTPHGALGGRQATEGCGPVSGASASAQPSAGRKKVWGFLLIRPPGDAVKLPRVEAVQRCQRSWR